MCILLENRIEKAPARFAPMPSAISGSIRISDLLLCFNILWSTVQSNSVQSSTVQYKVSEIFLKSQFIRGKTPAVHYRCTA